MKVARGALPSGERKSFYLPESFPHYPPPKDFRVEHVKIALDVDLEGKRISGTCTLKVKPVRDGPGEITLDACGLGIAGVRVDGKPAEYEYDGEKLRVKALTTSEGTATVDVSYSAVPNDGIYFIGPDERHHDKPLQAWTHSEAQFARYWFPCFDHPWEKFTSETLITVPRGFTVVSNGELVSKSEDGGKVTFHWHEGKPHSSYLTSFVAGKFGELKEESEGVSLLYYFPEARREDVRRYFGETPNMIKVFNDVTGVKYPYSKYAQTTVEDFIFGGMENIDATTLTTNRFHDANSDEDFQASYGTTNRNAVNLVAHELAHQWFGDLVTCSDWAHAWLNEGFADYMQVLYIEKTRGVDASRWDLFTKAEDAFEEDENDYRRPIVDRNYVYPDDVFDNTLYEKGAWMIHELRYLMGDSAFFRGVREYLTRFSFKNADTHDFRKVMEEASGLSLEQFFEQSFFMAGYPEFEVGYSWDAGAKSASVQVRQVQKRDDRTPLFVIPCDIVFYTSKGRQKKRVTLRGPEQEFSFELDSEPSIVEFDPEAWLLKKVSFRKSAGMLANQLDRSEDPISRAEAARQLGELKVPQAVEALRSAAGKEQFWFVNASALKALGKIGTPEALDALAAVGKPVNRRVRRALAEALGEFKQPGAKGILEDLLMSDPSPYVRAEAALSLGKAAGAAAFGALKEAMKSHSPNETLAEACLAAMGRIDTEEVRGIIRDSLPYGVPTRVRIGALKAIKERGHLLDYEVPILNEILLQDSEYGVRDYLVNKLIPSVADRRMLEALRVSSKTDRDNRVRRGALEALHQITDEAANAATVSELRDEVRQLKEANSAMGKTAAG